MIDRMARVEYLRYESEQILAEGVACGYPLIISVLAVHGLFKREGVPAPDDVLAFVSRGRITAAMVDNWFCPKGC